MTNDDDDEDDEREVEEEELEEDVNLSEPEDVSSSLIVYAFAVVVSLLYFLGLEISGFKIPVWLAALFWVVAVLTSLKINDPYNRTVILRLGKFDRVADQGIYYVLPFVEKGRKVDVRIVTTTFVAEQTLTKDNVPVDIDAVIFWNIDDAKRAVLNVQDFFNSLQRVSMTALRDSIGKIELTSMIARREQIDKTLEGVIEERAKNWGINIDRVELKEVRIPKDLQDAISRQAQADREKIARVTLAGAEVEASTLMVKAAMTYKKSPDAMKLRWMNQIHEIGLHGSGAIILMPADMPVAGVGGALGLVDFAKRKK